MRQLHLFLCLCLIATFVYCGPSQTTKKETATREITPAQNSLKNDKVVETNTEDEFFSASTPQRISHRYKYRVIYRRIFYPYFNNRGEVPFKIKIKLEKVIPKLKKLLKKYPKAFIIIKGYDWNRNSYKRIINVSYWRAKKTAKYLSWKSGIPLKKFRIYGKGLLRIKSYKARRVILQVGQ